MGVLRGQRVVLRQVRTAHPGYSGSAHPGTQRGDKGAP
jgi:hypothetical protein